MLAFILAAAAHWTDNSGSEERVCIIIDGNNCFYPLSIVKSTLILLASSLVGLAVCRSV
jgi:hypothetical protein